MIEILSVASEIYPLVKTGGLADVVGALPGALLHHEVHVRTLIPGYPSVMALLPVVEQMAAWTDLLGGKARLLAARHGGLDLIVLDAPHLYDRPGGPYSSPDGLDWPDNWARFAALGRAAAELSNGLCATYHPQIIHAHDWQAAMAATYIAFGPRGERAKTIVTIHNLAFQGRFGAEIFPDLGLPPAAFAVEGIEYYGGVGFLKGGLQCADAITTVSPTYAAEIRTPEYGMGLEGLLVRRQHDLHGVLNGIDVGVWDPETDPHLARNYSARNIGLRADNKRALEARFGLTPGDGPLFGLVSRLTWQKGIDLLVNCLDRLVAQGARLCVLGSGDVPLEQALGSASRRHLGKIGLVTAYDEELSHLIQAGADAILVPSRFEPCGLTQMFALRYGAIPVVSRVGGLADSVIDANDAALSSRVATGVQFIPVTEGSLMRALDRTIGLFGQPDVWLRMQRNAMKADFGWDASAAHYALIYRQLLGLTPE